jgi:hypothetical protein
MDNKERISKLETILKDLKAPVLKYFNSGLERADIVALFKENGIYPNPALMDLVEWHNGIAYPDDGLFDGVVDILVNGTLYSLEEMVSRKEELIDWGILDEPELYLPFMGTVEGEMYLLKNDPGGQVFYLSSAAGIYGKLRFTSIERMLDLVIECYEEKIFTIDETEGLQIDFDGYNAKIKAALPL